MKDAGLWLVVLIGLPFFLLAFIVSAFWSGLVVGWRSVDMIIEKAKG